MQKLFFSIPFETLILKNSFIFAILNHYVFIYPSELKRKIFSLNFDPFEKNFFFRINSKNTFPRLNYVWDKKRGRGFVINYLNKNQLLLTILSRFKTDNDETTNGIFIGGELPEDEFQKETHKMNNTGMAYYDGERWYHIWCTSNEGLASAKDMSPIPPTNWTFLGSDVLEYTSSHLVLLSKHKTFVDGVPLYIERFGIFLAGKPFMLLVQRITNVGDKTASYFYVYGDEPWLGNYGSSIGNIGWVQDHLIKYEEELDPQKYRYFGLYDYGNDAIGEGHSFTGVANFIEWVYDPPDIAFIVNQENNVIKKADPKKPLSSPLNRFIGGQWGPVNLEPQAYQVMVMAIGMAEGRKDGQIPIKPQVFFNISSFPYFN